jgi:hypothetical protein
MTLPALEDAMARVAIRNIEAYESADWREHSMADHLRRVLPGTWRDPLSSVRCL